ncbi:MAG: hybrid sensor histidine kinase/response regulator [Verrucomicrobiota bacterium]
MSSPLDHFSHSLLELYRLEVENQASILTNGLLELERTPAGTGQMQNLLRAAHSLKGAARIVNLQSPVSIAHAMEDCFVAMQNGGLTLRQPDVDLLFRGIDLLLQSASEADQHPSGEPEPSEAARAFVREIQRLLREHRPATEPAPAQALEIVPPAATPGLPAAPRTDAPERVLRLTAENLNRLLALAGESLVESRWLRPYSDSMHRLRRMQSEVARSIEDLRNILEHQSGTRHSRDPIAETLRKVAECQQFLAERIEELEVFDRRSTHLSHRLYLEVLRARMRPFGDVARRFPRMVRDLARTLGKEVRLEITGESTQVDREVLEKLESPLAHLLRNAVDHGCETPAQRRAAGKSPESLIRLEARQRAGMLQVTVSDDGNGIDQDRLRRRILEKNLAPPATLDKIGDAELLNFLFLPGLTLKSDVTEISGRGVGLDIVLNMVRTVRGTVRVNTQPGLGTRFQLQLPLTLSVIRALLFNVGGEPYALALAQISRTLHVPRNSLQTLEGRPFFTLDQEPIGIVTAHQVLECEPGLAGDELPVIVLGDRKSRYGLVVDRFLGEGELVVQPLDPRLGKVKDIHAAALMEDGAPVLILDVDDLIDSIGRLISDGGLARGLPDSSQRRRTRKRILAVDDSVSVRELEQKLLASRGYEADVAVDGIDAWNAVRTGRYDLVITDVDMPRLDGIELAMRIKRDPALKSLPVMIVSYKDGDEDRVRGLQAGADYYLDKGSFHDETLLQAVMDLIGKPEP